MQILSPPASNERVDFYNNQLIMGLVPSCSNSSTGSGLPITNSQSLFHNSVISLVIFFNNYFRVCL